MVEYVSLFQRGDATIEARKELLTEQRNQLIAKMEDMKKTLERLNYKIERYDQAVVPREGGSGMVMEWKKGGILY